MLRIQGNIIGLDRNGQYAIGNGGNGVIVENSVGTQIGGRLGTTGNTISGNSGDGIVLAGGNTRDSVVSGNVIGLTAGLASATKNGGRGIVIRDGVGGTNRYRYGW